MKWNFTWTPELFFKLFALVFALGIIMGRLNAMDARLERIEKFLDAHVSIQIREK
jgi:hypothetical protein